MTDDTDRWGRFLYLLIREHALIESRAWFPEWDDLTPKQRDGWVSDASEFIRGWKQAHDCGASVLAAWQGLKIPRTGTHVYTDYDPLADA